MSDNRENHNNVNGTGVLMKVPRSAGNKFQACAGRYRTTDPHYSEVAPSGRSGQKGHQNPPKSKTVDSKQFQKLCFGSINTRTAKDAMKLTQLISHSKHLKHDITFLQETHITGHQHYKFDDPILKGWSFVNSGYKSKARAGVGIILSPDTEIHDINVVLEGKILLIKLTVRGLRLIAIAAYAPTEVYSENAKDEFYSHLCNAVMSAKKNHPGFKLIIGSDMNATIGNDSENTFNILGKNNDALSTNDNGLRLLNFCQQFQLYLLNSFFSSKSIHRETWYSPNGFRKRTDYVIGDWYMKRFCTNCRVYRKASLPYESDHRLLAGHFSFPSKSLRKKIFKCKTKKPVSTPNIKLLKTSEEIRNDFTALIENTLSDIKIDTLPQPELVERCIVQNLEAATSATVPQRRSTKLLQPWVNENYVTLHQNRINCKDPIELKSLNKQIKK